ncbi:MAG: tetratricopeptide repeat protein [Myxococcales bacterium FL481]|nr:MAG: tetratricopeptide repeat protein [Myxococcales bacterium FL481]
MALPAALRRAAPARWQGWEAETVSGPPTPAEPSSESGKLHRELAQASIRARLFGEQIAPVRIGRFHLLDKLGQGGMGVVYAAYDESLDRKVALKFLRPRTAILDDRARQRIRREAQAMARLSHPNVVQVYEVGEFRGELYIAMEFVAGTTIDAWVASAEPDPKTIVRVFLQAGAGLAAAHAAGLVHRDFKPSNVLLTADHRALVTDFGSARGADGTAQDESASASMAKAIPGSSGSMIAEKLTMTGSVLGTPAYMSPEQHQGQTVTAQSDQFCFCASFYEALFRDRPFRGNSRTEVFASILTGKPTPASPDTLGTRLLPVLRRGLSFEPKDRYPDMPALLAALSSAARPRRRRMAVATTAALTVSGGLALAWQLAAGPTSPCASVANAFDDAWNSEKRREIEQLLRTVTPQALEQRAATIGALNSYADKWRASSNEACEDTHVKRRYSAEVLDRRTACLDDRRHEFVDLLEVLRTAKAQSLTEAPAAIHSIPSPRTCTQLTHAHRGRQAEDSATGARATQLRDALVRARSLYRSGRCDDAVEQAARTVEHARALDNAPVLAESLLTLGLSYEQAVQPSRAQSALDEAINVAMASYHDAVAADAWLAQLRLKRWSIDAANLPQAELLYTRAIASIDALPHRDDHRRANAELSIAYIYKTVSRLEEAERAAKRSLELSRRASSGDAYETIRALGTLADIHGAQRRHAAALDLYDEVLDMAQRVLGPAHHKFATLLANRGILRTAAGLFEPAQMDFDRAQEIYLSSQGNRNVYQAWIHTASAQLALHRGDPGEALSHVAKAREIHRDQLPADDVRHAAPMLLQAEARFRQEEFAQTADVAQQVIAFLSRGDPDHTNLHSAEGALARSWLGRALAQQGATQAAKIELDAALATWRDLTNDHTKADRPIIETRMARAQLLALAGAPDKARADLSAALAGATALDDEGLIEDVQRALAVMAPPSSSEHDP